MIIERLVRKGNYVNIFLEGSETIVIAYEVVLKSALRKGDSLSNEELNALMKENDLYLIKRSAIGILQRRMHSKREIKTKLLKKKYDKKLIDTTIEYLVDRNYLNEEQFTEQFIREKFVIRKNGPNKIRAELINKGIPREIIDRQINLAIGEEESIENALSLARKRLPRIENFDLTKKKQRLFSFLSSRGYSHSTIFNVFSALDLKE